MSYYLCLETSTEVCSVAVGNEERVLLTNDVTRKNSHTETLTIQIDSCLEELDIDYSDLSAID